MHQEKYAELARTWIQGLRDPQIFATVCSEDCQVWHSLDNVWRPLQEAVDAMPSVNGELTFEDPHYVVTTEGFLVQFSATLNGSTMHNTIIVTVENDKAVRVQEYVGLETDMEQLLGTS